MTDEQKPWTGDEEMRRRTKRFGLIVLGVILTAMAITAVTRFYGW